MCRNVIHRHINSHTSLWEPVCIPSRSLRYRSRSSSITPTDGPCDTNQSRTATRRTSLAHQLSSTIQHVPKYIQPPISPMQPMHPTKIPPPPPSPLYRCVSAHRIYNPQVLYIPIPTYPLHSLARAPACANTTSVRILLPLHFTIIRLEL